MTEYTITTSFDRQVVTIRDIALDVTLFGIATHKAGRDADTDTYAAESGSALNQAAASEVVALAEKHGRAMCAGVEVQVAL